MKSILMAGGGVLLGFILIFTGIAFFPESFAFNAAASLILIFSLIILFIMLIVKFARDSKI
ncbi:MAG TPA: hypothetical protein H9994_00915, partial [Candidatus Salinicoccus merdavium]|nr:hypothetical protein [Candidatus Salinicoccus merdavium]